MVATQQRAWVVDLTEARIVTAIETPRDAREVALSDEDTLCVLDREGNLRVHALPDGGCVTTFEARGAWAIAGTTARAVVLQGDATLRGSDGRVEAESGRALLFAADLRTGTLATVDVARLVRALNASPDARTRLGAAVGVCSPWGALSPDGNEFALSVEARAAGPQGWVPGELLDRAWTEAFTLRLDDPDAEVLRWAAPLEGWTLAWRDRDTLSGYIEVATGAAPYRTMPFARRRIQRDGAVITWHPDVGDLLLAPGASPTAVDLDDARFRVCIASVGAAHTITWDPTTDVTEVDDLLGDVPRGAMHPERPVCVGLCADGAWARSVPLRDGGADVSLDGVTRTRIGPRSGPPQRVDGDGPCVTLRWTPSDGAPWRTGFLRR